LWEEQDAVGIRGGGGKCCWSGDSALMQATINVADMFEDVDRKVPRELIPCASNKFVPHDAELVLQFGKRFLNIESRN